MDRGAWQAAVHGVTESDTTEHSDQDHKNIVHGLPRRELGGFFGQNELDFRACPISQDQRPWQERGCEARTQGSAAFPVEGMPPCLGPEPAHPACFGLCFLQRKGHLSSLCASLSQSTLAHFSFRPQNSDSTSQTCQFHSKYVF